MDFSLSEYIGGVVDIPQSASRALFVEDTTQVFRETDELAPLVLSDRLSVIPWGADNQMPYNILDKVQADETMSTCQAFNAEICYGAGLQYNTENAAEFVKQEVRDFLLDNSMPHYYLGVCQDMKHFGFCVTVIIMNHDATKVVRIARKEACNVRFTPADKDGRIENIVYADWRHSDYEERYEVIPLLDNLSPWHDLTQRIKQHTKQRKFAIVSRIPTPDNTYYPIPYYGSLFRGKWYDIKQAIATAKLAKLKNTAPIKYMIEVSTKYWEGIFARERITDKRKQQERVVKEKENIIRFLTGAENSGKVLFSTFYVNPNGEEQHEVVITKIDSTKEGGDWESDIQEAVNMMCFTMGVHSNLVGSVPGKAQTNNSGSDKRELYTIAQARQKPYHDLMFVPHWLIIRFNQWQGVTVDCPFLMLTTLDEHTDAKTVTTE